MIGFIALAGIIVRNSILLVEFARERVSEGMAVPEAITLAGRVRLRPIMITALALVIGSMVLLSDPIFQGMAVSLLFGSLVATFLTLVVIPLGCVSARKYFTGRPSHGGSHGPDAGGPGSGPTAPPSGGSGGQPAPFAPEPTGGRPPRLQRKSDETAASGEPQPVAAAPGRPVRLMRKSETEAVPSAPSSGEPAPPAPGRPPRLVRKSEAEPVVAAVGAPETASARPPRLIRKSEAETSAQASVPELASVPPGRPSRAPRKSEAEAIAIAPPALEAEPADKEPTRAPRKGRRSAARKPAAGAKTGADPGSTPGTDDSEAEINDLGGDSG